MISSLSSIITEALYKSQVIAEEDKELYIYGFFVLLSKGLFFLVSAIFGWMFGILWESIVFYIMFSTLRCYAGGFHASKESVCTCCTTIALFLASLSIWILSKVESVMIPLCVLVLCGAVVYLLSPLDSEDKPLTSDDFREYRRKSRMIVIILTAIAMSGVCMHLQGLLYAASTSIVLEGCLLVLGKVQKRTTYHNHQ